MGKYVNPHEGARRIEQKKKKYINSHSGAERNRGGVVEGTAYLAGNLGLGVAGVAEGLTDIAAAGSHLMRGDLYMAKQPFIEGKTAEAQRDLEEWYNPGGGMKLAGDVASGAGQSVSYGLLSAIPIIGKPLMFASIGSQGVSSAAGRTGDVGLKELGYGATVGAVEGILESKLGAGVNAVKSLGSAALKRTGVNVAKSAAKVGGKSMIASVLVDTAKGAAGEFAEEAISEAVDPALLRLFNIDENAQFNLGNVLYAGVVGALSGGLMTAGPAAINFESARKTGQSIREAGEVEQTLHTAEMLIKGAERAQTTAKESKAPEKPGKDASVGQKITATAKSAVSGIKSGQEASKARQMADKLQKNVAAYRQIMADPAKATSSVADALLGELRGNMYLAQVAYQIETYEAILANAEPEQKQQIVDVINAEAAKMGAKRSDYTVADLEANTDDIVTKLAAEMSLSSLARVFDTAEATEKPTEAPTSPWDGMADHEDMSRYKATGEAEQALLKAAVNQGVPRGSVPAMLEQFRKGNKLTPAEFAEGWAEGAHKYGRYGFDASEDGDIAFNRMEPEAREAAMKFGRETAEAEAKRADEAAKAKKKPEPKDGSEAKAEGRVIKGEGLDIKELSDEQYAGYKAAELMAKALGIDIVVEKSLTDTGGMQTNGYFDKPTNTLHININARRDGKNIALYTLGHEVAHYIKAWSPAKFKVLSDFVMEQLGGEAESLIEARVKTLRKIPNFKGLTEAQLRDLAVEDVVADGMELVLTDGDVLEELSRVDKTLWEKIRDWIFDIIGQIRRSYEGLNKVSKTAQVLADTMETFDEIERLFTEAVTEAGERTKTAEYGVEIDEKTGTALFSVQDAPQNETEFNAAVDRLVDKLGVDRLRAENWVRSEMSLSALILREDMYEYAHKKADRRLTAIVKNSDYKQGTLDFSNICRKRRQYTKMMERLQNEFPNRLFTAEDFALIRDILMEEDIEVACGLCYVEDRRQNEGYIATNFREAVQSWRAGNKATFRDSKSEADVAYSKGAAKAMEMLGKDTYVPTIAELTTVEGMAELGKEHPDVLRAWKAFNNSRGMQSSRLVTAEAEYQRQILKYSKNRVKAINDLGGLRIFSFSDFEEFHLIDIIQAVQDCAAMGIKIQFYTKVPSFAYLMKDTGAKGNMSLIPKGKLGYHMEGDRVVLDYDNVEGINTNDEYFKEISSDNPNIGTVLVGINETQIRAAMADSFIDYIIPFHSGQSGIVRQIKKIDAWENYKDVQTEKWLTKAEEGEKRGSPGVNIYTDVLQAAEKEGRPIKNERQFVEKFLQVCADKGVKPRFWEFLDTDADGKYVYTKGYYKLLLDFKMFDKNGGILPQGYVVPEFKDDLLTELTERYVEAEREEDTKNTAAMDRAFDQIVDRVINRNDPIYRTIKQPKAVNVRAGVDMVPTVSRVYSVEETSGRADRVYSLGENERITLNTSESQRAEILRKKSIEAPVYKNQLPKDVTSSKAMKTKFGDMDRDTRELVKRTLEKIAEDFNALNVEYTIQDVGVEIVLSKKGIRESISKEATPEKLAKMLPILKDTVERSVGIEVHRNRYYYDSYTTYFQNLLGGYVDEDNFVPVRFGLKHGSNGETTLYVVVDQEGIPIKNLEQKKKVEVFAQAQPIKSEASNARSTYEYSIAHIVQFVNSKDILRYIPDELLSEKQINIKYQGIEETAVYTNKKNDRKYMEFVASGNMQAATDMVRAAAKAAGYTEEMFHGMGGRYNVYKSGNGQYGSGVYFTADKDIAAGYGKVVDHLYVKVGKIADYEDAYRALGKTDDQTLDDFAQTLGFPNFDEMVNDWDNDPTDVASNSELIEMLKNRGFEGFLDDGNAGFVLWDFDGIAYRIKSADPVTYDDAGNVIPLSERFNETNPDIRYSVEDTTEWGENMGESPDVSAFDAAVRRSGISPKATDKETQRMVKEAEKRARAAERSAERSAKSEQATKEWARETVRKTRAQRDEAVYRARRDATEYKNDVYRRAYEKADEKNRSFRENMNRKAEEARMRKEMTSRKRTIMRVLGSLQTKLYNPTKTNHVPKELHDLAIKIMQTADPKAWDENRKNIREMGDLAAGIEKLERKVDRTEREQERLDAMKSKYEILEAKTMPLKKQAEALYTAYKLYNETLPKDMQIPEGPMAELSKLVDTIEDKPLKEMGLESLRAVETFVKALSHQINSANDLFLQKRGEQVSDWGNAASREAAESKPLKWLSPKSMEIKNARDVREFLWKNMKPLTAFEAIGSTKLMELFQSVLDGEEVWITDVLEAREAIVKAKEQYGYDTWDLKTRREFTNGEGKTVRLTVGEMMSLYAYAKREQAMGHLRGGGFVLDAGATEITEKSKIRTEKMLNLTERYTMTEEDMGKLAGMLTEEQKQYATEIQDYLTSLGEKGNEISRKLYGLDLFNEKYYFPIKVKSEYLESQTGKTGDPKIKNRGMSKETVPDAQNPLVLQDFMTIVSGHVNDMATYHAFVLPVEDLTRVLNYQPSNAIIDEEGNWTEDKERKEYSTLKAVIESKYGAQANAYIEQLIRDLNGGARREAAANLIDKGITAFKRASTMASLSVLVQQPTSVFRAMAYIDPKHFRSLAALDIKGHKEAWEQVKKYAKVAAIKEMGGYDTGVGTRTADYLNSKDYKTWGERAKAFFLPDVYGGDSNYRAEIFGKGAAYADELAWIQMFDACKREQAEKLGKSMDSEEVLEAAGKRFTEVVRRTQVYDSTLTRSEYMRSKDTGMKMATAFMAEPTTVVSMMLDGLIRANRGDKAFLKKTAGAIAASVIFNALAVSLIYAARDDDEDKTYTEKYLATLATETAEGFNPLEYLPYTRDVMSLMKGYDIERTDMALFADLFKSFERITSSTRTPVEKTTEVAGAVASFFGVPIRNLVRDAMIPVNLVQNAASGERTTGKGISAAIADEFSVITNLFGVDTTNAHELYKAAKSGDQAHYDRVASRYKSEQAAEMALRTALRENDRRIAEAAEAKISGELEAYESIIEKIESEGRFDRDLIIRAINNEVLDIKDNADQVVIPEEEVTDEEDETAEPLYNTSDLNDALTRGDREDFGDIYYYLLAVKQEQGKTEAQAKAAVKSGITSYWKKQYLAAWEENNTTEMKRILELLEGTELYGEYNDVATMASKWIKES